MGDTTPQQAWCSRPWLQPAAGGPVLHLLLGLTSRSLPDPTPTPALPLRSMADSIHAVVSGEGGLPSAVQWVMLGVSLLMCVVGAIFVSYTIK